MKHLQNLKKIIEGIGLCSTIESQLKGFSRSFVELLFPENEIGIRVSYDLLVETLNLAPSHVLLELREFSTLDGGTGKVEIYSFSSDENLKKIKVEVSEYLDLLLPLLIGAISQLRLKQVTQNCIEREKELRGINLTTNLLKNSSPLNESLQKICNSLPDAMQYPQYTFIKITYEGEVFVSSQHVETPWVLTQVFDTPDSKTGKIQIFYSKEFPEADEGPFLVEERNLINNLAALISGTGSKNALHKLLVRNTERLKELKTINRTADILEHVHPIDNALGEICKILPGGWQFPEDTVARIKYQNRTFESDGFVDTKWKMLHSFKTVKKLKGTIEICYLHHHPDADEGPFLKEEYNLLHNLTSLISGEATKDIYKKLHLENRERLKELKAINRTSKIIEKGRSVKETLQEICNILPKSWQYPMYAVARIRFAEEEYVSPNFDETSWHLVEHFITADNKKGSIDIYYLKDLKKGQGNLFLAEERNLLINIKKIICGYLDNDKARRLLKNFKSDKKNSFPPGQLSNSLKLNQNPLKRHFNNQSIDKYIYLEMMRHKVKSVLFVATLYDAFILESEESYFENFMGEIYQYSLFSLPRITGVTTEEEALELLKTSKFDLVILMVGLDRQTPVNLSKKIRNNYYDIPIYLLLNRKSDALYFERLVPTISSVDRTFVWNGDSNIFFAIVKSIEDEMNVENDTRIGLVRVILLVENSPVYYSKYLQIIYSTVFNQIQELLPEVEKNELDKISKMRSRPKILLATNYEEAVHIFNKYKDNMLCLICDGEFEISGRLEAKAGEKLIDYAKSQLDDLPVLLQSSKSGNKKVAEDMRVRYINKNSHTLSSDIRNFLLRYLGFGNFVFHDNAGNIVAEAATLGEFKRQLLLISDETFRLHALNNQFSLWLMARGEIKLAKTLNPIRLENFTDFTAFRAANIDAMKIFHEEKTKGKIIHYDETSIHEEHGKTVFDGKNTVALSGGSLGGKGRGLAFINTLINRVDFSDLKKEIRILSPVTVIIGTDEFHRFIEYNNLSEVVADASIPYKQLQKQIMAGSLSPVLRERVFEFICQIDKPVAVRSSSISEDSLTQPFAGVFDTYLIPNNSSNKDLMMEHVLTVIKLVYSSVYSPKARSYFNAIHHKIEEEKMAIVLQELVGQPHGNYYYPHASGTAQSYNYYPVANMNPDEGIAHAAVGLGKYVVDGWKSHRFSPRYPKLSMHSVDQAIKSSQVKFFALDCSNRKLDFLAKGEMASLEILDIDIAAKDGVLTHCGSTYDVDNDRIIPGVNKYGPLVINFANILQYDYIPLAKTISKLLDTIEEAMGTPVEIEYAIDIDDNGRRLPSFYLLQIKPMHCKISDETVELPSLEDKDLLLYTTSSLGNGQVIDVTDVIYVDNQSFDKMQTLEMAAEIEYLNSRMVAEGRHYLLIGPGRWGTRDRFLGIPVTWSQISNAKVIVETSLEKFPLDASLGSHFFHNVTSMNIGYFAIRYNSKSDFINWEKLKEQKIVHSTNHFKHVRFKTPLNVQMNGIQRKSVILF